MLEWMNLLGAIIPVTVYVLSIITFASRLAFKIPPGHWSGIPMLLMTIPLAYLLVKAPQFQRAFLYCIQVGLMILWIVILFLLDYVTKIEFRQIQWMVITFVVLYFAGAGGLLGVASEAGRTWTIAAIILSLVSAVLAFVQRAVTGY